MDQLKKWCLYIFEKFSKFSLNLKISQQQDCLKSVENYLKLYEEPVFDNDGNVQKEKLPEETVQLKLDMPLKDGLLKINLGVPFIFVLNKSDVTTANSGDKKRFEEDSEFILKHIRKFAITCKFLIF